MSGRREVPTRPHAPAAAATNATFTTAGTYTLTLTVSDGTLSGSDSLAVTVSDAQTPADVWPADDNDSDPQFHGWAKVDASTVGMTQGGLNDAATFAQNVPDTVQKDPATPGKEPGNGMIVRHGQLVHFWGDIDERLDVKSVTKSMGGSLLGVAIDENKVTLAGKGVDFMERNLAWHAGSLGAADLERALAALAASREKETV